jgi:DNA excision repair protein ERCC-4
LIFSEEAESRVHKHTYIHTYIRTFIQVGHKTKQLVEDLKTLRKLLTCLITHDCVSFLDLLETLRATGAGEHGMMPFWLMTAPAERLFKHAKERVFRILTTHNNRDAPHVGNKRLECVLEANPKWTLLSNVLDEVVQTRAQMLADGSATADVLGGTIIVTRDERTASRARDVLCYGAQSCLRHAFKRFCTKKREAFNSTSKRAANRVNGGGAGATGAAAVSSRVGGSSGSAVPSANVPMTAAQVELQLLVEEGESALRMTCVPAC